MPDDVQWVAQFMGAIWRMSLQTHYERDADHSAVGVAARWRQVWTEAQEMSTCCDPTINDITSNTSINVQMAMYLFELNQLYIAAGLDIDVAFPDTPDNFDTDPGDVGDAIAQRDRALCLTTQSFVNETFNRGLSWMYSQTEEVAGIVAGGVLIPIIPVYAVVGAFIGAGVLVGTIALQLADEDYRAYIACAMYDELKGKDTNLKSAFYESADNLPARPPPPQNPLEDGARDIIEVWLRSQLNNVENYLGFIKSLNLAMGMSVGYTDEDCPCEEVVEWSHTWLMTSGNDDIINDEICGVFGTYNAIDDRYESVVTLGAPCTESGAVSIEIPLPGDGFVTSARMRFDMYNEQFFNRDAVISSVESFDDPAHVEHAKFTGNQQYFDILLEAEDVGVVASLFFSVLNRQTSGTAGRSKVLQVTIEGTGTDPYP